MGMTSMGTPFFHCCPRTLESFLRGGGGGEEDLHQNPGSGGMGGGAAEQREPVVGDDDEVFGTAGDDLLLRQAAAAGQRQGAEPMTRTAGAEERGRGGGRKLLHTIQTSRPAKVDTSMSNVNSLAHPPPLISVRSASTSSAPSMATSSCGCRSRSDSARLCCRIS